jgi:hypothetical protein
MSDEERQRARERQIVCDAKPTSTPVPRHLFHGHCANHSRRETAPRSFSSGSNHRRECHSTTFQHWIRIQSSRCHHHRCSSAALRNSRSPAPVSLQQQAVDVLLPHCTSDLSTSAPSWSVRYKDFRTDFSSATIVSRQRSGRSRRRRSSPVQHCSRRRCWQSGPLPAADSLLQRINNKHNLQYTIASYRYAHHHRRR